MKKLLTEKEYIEVANIVEETFNDFYIFENSENVKNSDSGIGKAIEPFFKDALNKVTEVQWRQGDKDTEPDFVDDSGVYESIELKTTIGNTFVGGCTGGRIPSLQKNPEKSLKYTLDKNDNSKIYVYDPKPYVLIDFDRPNNGYEKFYIKRLYVGNIREVDWDKNRSLTREAKDSLNLLIDNSNSMERYIRIPWQIQNNKEYDRDTVLKYIIGETYDKDLLKDLIKLCNNQIKYIMEKNVNSLLKIFDTLDESSQKAILNKLQEKYSNNI